MLPVCGFARPKFEKSNVLLVASTPRFAVSRCAAPCAAELLVGGATELYHNSSNAKKVETTTTGVQTTGPLNVNGAYTLPTSDGSAGQALQTDGSGAVTFGSAGASTGFVIAMSVAL